MRLLPDTSIWVEYLRHGAAGPAGDLDRHLDERAVVVCGPVAAELVAGTPPARHDDLWTTLTSLPWADLDVFAWRDVGSVAGVLHRVGRSVALTDVAIAVAAVRADAVLWTRDDDFERIADVYRALRLYG